MNRYFEEAQADSKPFFSSLSILSKSENTKKWSFLTMFTCISNADRLLIPLVCFSLFLHLLDSYVDNFSCENIKS